MFNDDFTGILHDFLHWKGQPFNAGKETSPVYFASYEALRQNLCVQIEVPSLLNDSSSPYHPILPLGSQFHTKQNLTIAFWEQECTVTRDERQTASASPALCASRNSVRYAFLLQFCPRGLN
jgi:hypothetical protein